MIQLWLLHLLPFLAIIPLFISGAVTVLGVAVAGHKPLPVLQGLAAALGAGTALAYLFFMLVALMCGSYPLGYLLEVAGAVSRGEELDSPLPLGRWLVRPAKGLYVMVLIEVVVLALLFPALFAVAALAHLFSEVGTLGAALFTVGGLAGAIVLVAGLTVVLSGVLLRLTRSLNPLQALNPLALLRDLGRGWKQFFLLQVGCIGLYWGFCAVSLGVMIAAPFMVAGPLLMVPGILVGLGQNYLMLAAANACGQYSRLYVR